MFLYRKEDNTRTYLRIGACVCWFVAFIYVFTLLCMWRSLQISLAVLESASDFVGSNLRIVFVPLVFFVINMIVFIAWILAIVAVFSSGDIDNSSSDGSQLKTVKWTDTTRGLVYFMGFGILWIIAFLIACA